MNNLIEAIRDRRALLFVGAGVSATLGLPTWSKLMDHIANELDFDPDVMRSMGDHYEIAEYYSIKKKGLGPLRSWMDKAWDVSEPLIKASDIYRLIVELKFPIIYTTNYDSCLEKAHRLHGVEHRKIVTAGDIPLAGQDSVQIIKFHGDFDNDPSLVLTESSYFDRMTFDAPLDIRLRSDLLGKDVLFIGYSLKDMNMRLLLYRLARLWNDTPYESERPAAHIFMSRPNAVQEDIFKDRGINPIIGKDDDPTESLKRFLEELLDAVAS